MQKTKQIMEAAVNKNYVKLREHFDHVMKFKCQEALQEKRNDFFSSFFAEKTEEETEEDSEQEVVTELAGKEMLGNMKGNPSQKKK